MEGETIVPHFSLFFVKNIPMAECPSLHVRRWNQRRADTGTSTRTTYRKPSFSLGSQKKQPRATYRNHTIRKGHPPRLSLGIAKVATLRNRLTSFSPIHSYREREQKMKKPIKTAGTLLVLKQCRWGINIITKRVSPETQEFAPIPRP